MAGFIQKGISNILQRQPHDVVILSALRTPVTRAYKGGFKHVYDHELLAAILKATLARFPNLDPALVQDVAIGTVLSELGGSKAGRMAALHAGFPASTAFHTINRACASGLAAITTIAHSIAVGSIDIGIGGGMESMTRNYGSKAIPTSLWEGLRHSDSQDARCCIMSMGVTSENVAERYGVTREAQDEYAARSQQKAADARRWGLFDQEIIPVATRAPAVEGKGEQVISIEYDDGLRPGTTPEKLATMKPAFKPDGASTAGNSSQISDGAAAALMMRRSTATALGLEKDIIGKWAGTQVVGCHPDEMGVGPALAIPKLMDYTGIRKEDIGLWEINEAFASQVLYCIRKLELDEEKINVRGGAIALGHPLGATGARQLATLLPAMEERGAHLGVISMCIGTGMGKATLIVREYDN